MARNFKDNKNINSLLNNCFNKQIFCKKALLEIHTYQEKAERYKNFSCQTRLLGLEANLIMAMNFNLKRNKAKKIINAVRKYC
tara:strand:- start:39 stop:287 length:249 start_codon:yes stop_codon:yes gene_type:complete